jgi:hypothetical protein
MGRGQKKSAPLSPYANASGRLITYTEDARAELEVGAEVPTVLKDSPLCWTISMERNTGIQPRKHFPSTARAQGKLECVAFGAVGHFYWNMQMDVFDNKKSLYSRQLPIVPKPY